MTISVHEFGQKGLADGDISEERASRFFLVKSTTAISGVTASVATGIPTYFDAHPDNSAYLMKSKRARAVSEDGGRYAWEVQCDYSNRIITPLSLPAQIEWDFSEASEEYWFDTNTSGGFTDGHPVRNSAGQPFDAIPSRETGSITCNITKNVATDFDVSLFSTFRQKVNSVAFDLDGVTIAIEQAKFSGASVSAPQLSNGEWYRAVKLVIKFKASWLATFADVGYFEKQSTLPYLKPINVNGPGGVPTLVSKPWPLNGSGAKMTYPDDKPAKLTFKPYLECDFGDLSELLS